MLLVGLKVAATKENKNNHFIGFAMGLVIVAGACGAGAVSGGCFNPAVATGIEDATNHLGLGYCGCTFCSCCSLGVAGCESAKPATLAQRP